MASNRQDPVPGRVDADVTRPVEIAGTNTRPLPRTPPPPRNPEPPPASRLTTRERLEAAASRFMDALPDGVGIPSDDDDADADATGPVPELSVDIQLDVDDDKATRAYQPVGIPADDDSGTFATDDVKAAIQSPAVPTSVHPGQGDDSGIPSVISSAKPPAPPRSAAPPAGKTKKSRTAIFSGPVNPPGARPAPPSMSSLGMKAATPDPVDEPIDTQEIDLDDVETEDSAVPTLAADDPTRPNIPVPGSDTVAAETVPAARAKAAQTAQTDPAPPKVTTTPSSRPAQTSPVATSTAMSESSPLTPATPKRRTGLWLGLVAVALVAGGGVGAWQMGLLEPYLGGNADQAEGARIADAGRPSEGDEPESNAVPPTAGATSTASDDAADPGSEHQTDDEPETDTSADPEVSGDGDGDGEASGDGEAEAPTPTDDGGEEQEPPGEAPTPEGADPDPAPSEAGPVAATSPTPSLSGDGSLAAARAQLAKDPAKAHDLAEAVYESAHTNASLEIMALAGCASDDGKQARAAYKKLGDSDARKNVVAYCENHTEINVRARANDYLAAELMRMGERAYVRGAYDEALDLVQKAQKKRFQKGAGQLLVAIYCAQGNETKARYMLRRMPEQSREVPLAQCKAKGVVISQLDEI